MQPCEVVATFFFPLPSTMTCQRPFPTHFQFLSARHQTNRAALRPSAARQASPQLVEHVRSVGGPGTGALRLLGDRLPALGLRAGGAAAAAGVISTLAMLERQRGTGSSEKRLRQRGLMPPVALRPASAALQGCPRLP